MICSSKPYSHTLEIYYELEGLKIRDIYYVVILLVDKLLPRIFDEYFTRRNVFHTHGTGNAHLHRLPIC